MVGCGILVIIGKNRNKNNKDMSGRHAFTFGTQDLSNTLADTEICHCMKHIFHTYIASDPQYLSDVLNTSKSLFFDHI